MSRASAPPHVERRQSARATPDLPDGSYRVAVERPEVRGKFLFRGDEKVYAKGVTYGTFRPDPEGYAYPSRDQVDRDFAGMAANGVNAVRTYTVPPRWLLDLAQHQGLLIMVGFAWEHHVAFLEDRGRAASIEQRLREGVRACAGHPAVLCYSIGNEVPAPIVRWHGRRRVERFLRRLHATAKEEDPGGLVTYVNYPPTEYLDLSFADFFAFNVYLEERERLEAYLARLHNLAGDRPLVMAEIGLDSRSHGEERQAEVLSWQVETAFRAGCAGAFLFAWTDEWHITHLGESGEGQGVTSIEDWDFGLVDRDRRPKPALEAVREAFATAPRRPAADSPRFSVIVCTHNGGRTLPDTMRSLSRLDYPNFEVLVVDDGSTDDSAAIARAHGARVISTPNRGLSSARNTGAAEATGEIVAYLDDDAYPDRDWLTYLADAYRTGRYVGVGGPNVAPGGERGMAAAVALAPGNPTHVLVADREAEHIPGCNGSFRVDALEAVGGFDEQFHVAGDDVDLCWRLREAGGRIGFSPAAMVWHHRRDSLRSYWKQQQGYGRAEALLERKWPEKYNAVGHPSWGGRVYSTGLASAVFRRDRVYHGTWGTALFQSLYEREPGVRALPTMPEWYLVLSILALVSALGAIWAPLLAGLSLLVLAAGASIAHAVAGGMRAAGVEGAAGRARRARVAAEISLLILAQPLARLIGRLALGLTPWRWGALGGFAFPTVRTRTLWSERWRSPESWLHVLESKLRAVGAAVLRGHDFDAWDLTVRRGALARVRVHTAIEEHGRGRQLVRVRVVPRPTSAAPLLIVLVLALGVVAAFDGAAIAAATLCGAGIVLGAAIVVQAGGQTGSVLATLDTQLLDEGASGDEPGRQS